MRRRRATISEKHALRSRMIIYYAPNERARFFDGANRRGERERKGGRRNERVLIIFHGLHDRVHAPEVTRAAALLVSPRNKRETRTKPGRNET